MIRRGAVVACMAAFGFVLSGRAASQSVDDIIAKNIEAKGGLARLKAIDSIKQTSKLTLATLGLDAGMTIYSKRPNLLRQEISMSGRTVVNGFDGVTPWIINPNVTAGGNRPITVSGAQADMIRDQALFDGPLVDYKSRGYTIDLLGTESLGERKVHHLRLTSPTRQISHLYLDSGSGLDVKLATEIDKLTLEQEFADFRTVEGVTVPFHIRSLANGVLQSEIRVQSVEFNVKMDDAIFRMPRG